MADKFNPIRPDEIAEGDYVKIETRGGALVEGKVGPRRFTGVVNVANIYIADSDVKTAYRRLPKVELPVRFGSAVLIYNVCYLRDEVVIKSSDNKWHGVDRGNLTDDQVEYDYVRTLFDAAQAG